MKRSIAGCRWLVGWLVVVFCYCCCCLGLVSLFCFLLFRWVFSLPVKQQWIYWLNKGEVSQRNLQPWVDIVQDFRTKANNGCGRREWQTILLLSSRDGSENAPKDKFSNFWHCKPASTALDRAWAKALDPTGPSCPSLLQHTCSCPAWCPWGFSFCLQIFRFWDRKHGREEGIIYLLNNISMLK